MRAFSLGLFRPALFLAQSQLTLIMYIVEVSRLMRKIFVQVFSFFVFLMLVHQAVAAEIYKTIDKQGRVVYTDRPPAHVNAKIVELPSINALPAPQYIPNDNSVPNAVAVDDSYQINVINPVSGVVLSDDKPDFSISVNLNRALEPGHVLVYFLDGYIVGKTTERAISVLAPSRGEHKLHVDVMNKYGKSLGQSDPITLVVQRPAARKKT